jgi:hypothetical protein
LRISLFKVGKEFAVSEMSQAGGVVSHSISISWEEEGEVAVAVLLLVSTVVVAQLGSNLIGGDRSFVHSRDGGGVVAASANGAIGNIGLLGDEADLCKLAGMFQVTIRDGPLGVVEGNQILLDILGKGLSPHVGSALVIIEDPTHTSFRGVSGAQEGRVLRHYLSQVRGPVTQAGCQGGKGINVTLEGCIDADSVSFGPGVSLLECTEETRTAWYGCGHELELSDVLLPGLVADPSRGGQVIEDGGQG